MTINTFIDALRELLIIVPAILFTITIHEFFQGLMAIKLGDRSLKDSGALKFNPFYYIDTFGFICFVLFQYGWTKSINFDSRNFKNYKLDNVAVTLTGLAANLMGAFIFILLIILYRPNPDGYPSYLFMSIIDFNLKFFFLNLLPLPPLAGGKILSIFFPRYSKLEFIGIIIIILLCLFNITKFIDIIAYNLKDLFI
jgi:Zn-dependent protease